ncbi:hypothetical protein C900_02681 [Fulvivirga imtechensis AK7]|uniref:Uncharacterized protein n=1 Tax=Fulvivirga imtechensis AK7 TaxID=1237149 RepID=L8JWZ2_9BACT|nr:hypothetical protein [Fulvivirga imtechensis]ELR73596.1 hypothetical protein C900_02681 [Fulvivirga imtechensis AK7]
MKKILLTSLCSVLVGGLLAQYPGVHENAPVNHDWQHPLTAKQGKSILDYYLLLPDYIFECEIPFEHSEAARLNAISYKSIKNGYIKAQTNEGEFTVVMFKDRQKNRDIIAITKCGAGCQCFVNTYLQFDTMRELWVDASDVMPSDEEFESVGKKLEEASGQEVWPLFILPEHGTTIMVVDDFSEDRQELYKLVWAGGKFSIQM